MHSRPILASLHSKTMAVATQTLLLVVSCTEITSKPIISSLIEESIHPRTSSATTLLSLKVRKQEPSTLTLRRQAKSLSWLIEAKAETSSAARFTPKTTICEACQFIHQIFTIFRNLEVKESRKSAVQDFPDPS